MGVAVCDVARRGMMLSSSKRTLALAGFAADRRKRGFSVALSPGDRASPSVLEETASVRSRLLSRPRAGSLQGGSRRRTPTRRRLAVKRKARFLAIVRHHRNMPHEFASVLLSTRRRGPLRLLPLACRPATDTNAACLPLFGCHARAGCRRRRRSRALRCVFVVLGSGPF